MQMNKEVEQISLFDLGFSCGKMVRHVPDGKGQAQD